MSVIAAPPLAAGISAGGIGFLMIMLLIAAAVGLFVAMVGSLKRMRRNLAQGTFHGTERPPGDADPRVPGEQGREPAKRRRLPS